jgi:hypothetical protein
MYAEDRTLLRIFYSRRACITSKRHEIVISTQSSRKPTLVVSATIRVLLPQVCAYMVARPHGHKYTLPDRTIEKFKAFNAYERVVHKTLKTLKRFVFFHGTFSVPYTSSGP